MPQSGYFDVIFGASGNLAAVPDGTTTDGSVNYTQGYGVNYTLSPGTAGALNVEETKLNQIFNDITTAIQQYQQHGTFNFITSAMNGGSAYSYSKGDRVRYDNGSGAGPLVYVSLIANNTSLPTVATAWRQTNPVGGVVAAQGSLVFDNGIIANFGTAFVSPAASQTVTLPTSFANMRYMAVTTPAIDADGAGSYSTSWSGLGVNALTQLVIRNHSASGFNVSYICIGS